MTKRVKVASKLWLIETPKTILYFSIDSSRPNISVQLSTLPEQNCFSHDWNRSSIFLHRQFSIKIMQIGKTKRQKRKTPFVVELLSTKYFFFGFFSARDAETAWKPVSALHFKTFLFKKSVKRFLQFFWLPDYVGIQWFLSKHTKLIQPNICRYKSQMSHI